MRNFSYIFAAVTYAAQVKALSNEQIFSRPVISRAYEQDEWVLRNANGTGLREDAHAVGQALAGLKPSYVSGVIYLESQTELSATMIDDWHTIRSAVHVTRPDAKFDVEISLNPDPPNKQPFASADALVTKMKQLNAELQPEGWWFDFYSTAQASRPDWITAAVKYAHSQNQTVGGNVFDDKVPPGSDAVAFVDKPVTGSEYGFDFNRTQVDKLKTSSTHAMVIGHLQSNAQNGPTTESSIYIDKWTEAQRLAYLKYWNSQQCKVGFTFMWPVFYPLYPGAFAFDPIADTGSSGSSLYDQIQQMILSPKDC